MSIRHGAGVPLLDNGNLAQKPSEIHGVEEFRFLAVVAEAGDEFAILGDEGDDEPEKSAL